MVLQIFLVLFILINLCSESQVNASPVLLWSHENFPKSTISLSTMSPIDIISDHICQMSKKNIHLSIFAVNDLTIEDVQRGSQRNHPLLLDAKKAETNFTYYPNVADDAYETFLLIPQSSHIKCSNFNFKLKSSEIYDTLEDAMNMMKQAIDATPKKSNTAILFALINGPSENQILSRQSRQINNNQTSVQIMNNKTCMFYAKQLYWNNGNESSSSYRAYNLSSIDSTCQPIISPSNKTSIILKLKWTNDAVPMDIVNMSIIATIVGRYWILENVTLNNKHYRYFAYGMYSEMETPPTYSYVCTKATFVQYDGLNMPYGKYNFRNQFYITNLQFQPFNGNGLSFGLPNYCTSFFTSGIWMAITTSLLCLGILLFGIYRLMTIKSNDRFDDPKGKPLIIKAQE